MVVPTIVEKSNVPNEVITGDFWAAMVLKNAVGKPDWLFNVNAADG